MPITPANLTPALVSALTAQGIAGPQAISLAQGVSQGFTTWVPTLTVSTFATGSAGVGAGTGRITLEPTSGIATLAASLAGVSLAGAKTPALAQAIIQGLFTVLNTQAIVQTTVAAVAVGTGVGGIINANPASATPLFAAGLAGAGLAGPKTPALAAALGSGLSTWLSTGVVNTAIAGTPLIPPVATSGAGIGKLL